jgi:hypothetical protein
VFYSGSTTILRPNGSGTVVVRPSGSNHYSTYKPSYYQKPTNTVTMSTIHISTLADENEINDLTAAASISTGLNVRKTIFFKIY